MEKRFSSIRSKLNSNHKIGIIQQLDKSTVAQEIETNSVSKN